MSSATTAHGTVLCPAIGIRLGRRRLGIVVSISSAARGTSPISAPVFGPANEAVADGSDGCTPSFPPNTYWGWRYQSAEGQAKVAAWFSGYPHGARAAEEDGVGNWTQISKLQADCRPSMLSSDDCRRIKLVCIQCRRILRSRSLSLTQAFRAVKHTGQVCLSNEMPCRQSA